MMNEVPLFWWKCWAWFINIYSKRKEKTEEQQEHFLSDSTQSGRRMCGLQAMLAVIHFKATRLQSYCNHITFFNSVTFYCADFSNYINVHVTGVTKVGQPGGYEEKKQTASISTVESPWQPLYFVFIYKNVKKDYKCVLIRTGLCVVCDCSYRFILLTGVYVKM